jgi:FkbM family methyltransferase
LDIGRNIGNHTLFFAGLCPSETVCTFEPIDRFYRRLVRNVQVNNLQHKVRPSLFGLSSENRRIRIEFANKIETIEVRCLDDVDIPKPVSVMKIDVEGMEVDVILGAQALIKRERPVIFAEANTGDFLESLDRTLADIGYGRTGRVWNASPTYEYTAL